MGDPKEFLNERRQIQEEMVVSSLGQGMKTKKFRWLRFIGPKYCQEGMWS